MSKKSIFSGILISVISGVILFLLPKISDWVITSSHKLWSFVVDSYLLPGWFLFLLSPFLILGLIHTILWMKPSVKLKEPEYYSYTEDMIHNCKWRWNWVSNQVDNLWCFCPKCDGTLVYHESDTYSFRYGEPSTKFICENCNKNEISSIEGGDLYYALGVIRREISRRIRTEKFKKY